MKITDRIILRTIDGKVIVRPEASVHNNWVEYSDMTIVLTAAGIDAWNRGEDIDFDKGHISAALSNKIILNAEF